MLNVSFHAENFTAILLAPGQPHPQPPSGSAGTRIPPARREPPETASPIGGALDRPPEPAHQSLEPAIRPGSRGPADFQHDQARTAPKQPVERPVDQLSDQPTIRTVRRRISTHRPIVHRMRFWDRRNMRELGSSLGRHPGHLVALPTSATFASSTATWLHLLWIGVRRRPGSPNLTPALGTTIEVLVGTCLMPSCGLTPQYRQPRWDGALFSSFLHRTSANLKMLSSPNHR